MKGCTLITSKNDNHYLYDREHGESMYCHPLLRHFIELAGKGADPQAWFERLPEEEVKIKGYGNVPQNQLGYYLQKFLLMRENGYFAPFDNDHYLSGRLKPEDVESALANIRQVTFEVTDACNLNCEYCGYGKFYSDYDHRADKKLDVEAAKRAMDYLLELSNSPLNQSHHRPIYISFYGGEPLMNMPFIEEMVDYVNNLDFKHNHPIFSMTTNALLLEKNMDYLKDNQFNLLISLDGDETGNTYRVLKDGGPAYPHIIRNVEALQNKYPDYFQSNVNFNAVFHNKNNVQGLHKYFKERFDKTPTLSELNTTGINDALKEEFWATYANVHESLMQAEDYSLIEKDMFMRLPNIQGVGLFIDQFNNFTYRDYNEFIFSNEHPKRIPTGTCLPFSKKIFITVNGKVLPCERIGQQHNLGSVDHTKMEIDFQKVATLFNGYYDKIKKQCTACSNSEVCMQCIFNLDIEKPSPKCKGIMSDGELGTLLGAQISYIEENPSIYTKIIKEVIIE
jgi:uncharacterized protein